MIRDAAMVTIACVLAIQMGLVGAVEDFLHYEFRVLSCPKCATFWVSLGVHLLSSRPIIDSVAASFIASYVANWLALIYDAFAVLYNKYYEKLSEQTTDTDKEEPGAGSNEVSKM